MNSNEWIEEVRNVSGFSKLKFSCIGKVDLVQSDHEALVIEATPEICRKIKTEVANDTLSIYMTADFLDWLDIPLNRPDHIIFHLQMKDISELSLAGAGSLNCPKLTSAGLQITLSGSGKIELNQADLQSLGSHLSGAGSIEISGKAQIQTLTLSGAGSYEADNLESNQAQVNLSGVGNARIWAKETLDVHISGAGGVEYFGHPRITQKISGIGMLKDLGNR